MLNIFKNLFGTGTDFKTLKQQGAVIIDVRTSGEFQSGHLKGAINIPVNTISQHINDFKKKGKPVITCCASGMRSGSATDILKQAEIDAYNGGSWTSLNNKLN